MTDSHEIGAVNTLLVVFVLALNLGMGYLLKKYKFYYVPESAAAMMLGMAIGAMARIVYPTESELSFLRFQPELFFFLLLPPIIFEAGFSLRKKRFFRNLTTITLLAVVGTIVSTFIIGLIIFGFGKAGVVRVDTNSPLQSLLFGALISAVDPVATLAIMGTPELQCNKMLYSLVFGESVLNDAVAIVLFRTFAQLTQRDAVDLNHWASYVMLIGEFTGISLGSIIVGVLVGLACSALCFHTNLKQYPAKETTVMFLFAYASYAVAESMELSGIMALFFSGIIMQHYCWHNLSESSQITSHNAFASFAWTTETVVFTYMGMVLFTGELSGWDPAFIILGILACLVARAFNVFPISYVANCRRKRPIPTKMMCVMWFAGLRGAIAFALALNMPNMNNEWDNDYIVTTTLSIVIFTTIVCGGLTEPVLTKSGMKTGLSDEQAEDAMAHGASIESSRSTRRRGGLHAIWKRFDLRYMRPVFGGEQDEGSSGHHGHELVSRPSSHGEHGTPLVGHGGGGYDDVHGADALAADDYEPPMHNAAAIVALGGDDSDIGSYTPNQA